MSKRKKADAADPAKTFKTYRETFYQILDEKLRGRPGYGYLRDLQESIERQCSGSPLPAAELERYKADLFEMMIERIPRTGLLKLAQLEAQHHVRATLDPSWPDRSADFARRVDTENERRKDEEAARRAETSAMMPEIIARAKARLAGTGTGAVGAAVRTAARAAGIESADAATPHGKRLGTDQTWNVGGLAPSLKRLAKALEKTGRTDTKTLAQEVGREPSRIISDHRNSRWADWIKKHIGRDGHGLWWLK